MIAAVDDYPDLDFGLDDQDDYDTSMSKKKFVVPVGSEEVGIGRTQNFVSDPTVVHFGGFSIHEEHTEEISVINIASHSQRISILPPTTDEYTISLKKCGILAPGMAQKITVKFVPKEYKYYYDCIRIHADGRDLLIPLHGYPAINKVEFPALISFGNCPLSEPAKKIVTLRCSIPVNFSYNIEVIQPHPYFKINPLRGVVPANGSINIVITFNPITLGTCTTVVRLYIAQHNFKPIEAVINARAVSGILETAALRDVERSLSATMEAQEDTLVSHLGNSTFKSMQIRPETLEPASPEAAPGETSLPPRRRRVGKDRDRATRSKIDPVAAVLKKTFGADDVSATLKSAMVDSKLMSCKVPAKIESGPLVGTYKVVGDHKATLPVNKRGVGSGNTFDAGAEYIAEHNRRRAATSNPHASSVSEVGRAEDRVVEGLRVPERLDSTAAVNFVLTQESGKLKPKDLKIAIERNREERKKQELEQQKIREEGGGGDGGGCLDLRAILADEKLNGEPGDAFKRQLREMAFLADVEDLKKMEVEKTFRVSEEFLGGTMLSQEDVEVVLTQRKAYARHRKRVEWRAHQARMHSTHFLPESDVVKAGAPTKFILAEGEQLAHPASFDPNKNDLWAKRMNTLRKFVALVGTWIVRRRVVRRLESFRKVLTDHNISDKESMRVFVDEENSKTHRPDAKRPLTVGGGAVDGSATKLLNADGEMNESLALLVLSMPNQAVEKKKRASAAMNETFNVTSEMARRVLFPKFVAGEASSRKKMEMVSIDDPMNFDDRSFFQLKVRAEYVDMDYHKEQVPKCPVYFLPISSINQPRHRGAPEEKFLRPPAGAPYSTEDIQALLASGSEGIFSQTSFPLPPPGPELRPEVPHGKVTFSDSNGAAECAAPVSLTMETGLISNPTWMTDSRHTDPRAVYSEPSSDRDVFRVRPEYRTYGPQVTSKETDPDWVLRPTDVNFEFDQDSSLRSSLLSVPGFMSAHTYILGSYSSRTGSHYPQPGPTLSNFYMPDLDRHGSGLNCMRNDYTRSLLEGDHDVTPLQHRLAKEDYLTDSESDDDEAYEAPKPTMHTVKDVLKFVPPPLEPVEEVGVGKGKGKAPAKKVVEAAPPVVEAAATAVSKSGVDDADAFSVLDDEKRRTDQVELMRDRKILEYQTFMRKEKEKKMNAFTERLVKISQAATCPLQALQVQLPIHQYEDEVLDVLEGRIPNLSNSFVEQGLDQSLGSPSKMQK